MEILNQILFFILLIGTVLIWLSFLKNLWNGIFGIDIIAGVALASTFIDGQYLAGVVVLVMFLGGQFLEDYALRRAKKELSLLISRTPTVAHLKVGNNFVETQLTEIKIGDTVLIKPSEIVSVDGVIVEGVSSLNEAVLTGESNPIEKKKGLQVFAGTENISNPIIVKVLKNISDTKYSEILNLVKDSENHKAKIVRLADKYSVYFTVVTFFLASLAWFFTGDFVRVISVLVVATPCPLLIATPVAIMSGMSKAFKKGILVKSGVGLETLSRVNNFVFDKTGTITFGLPTVSEIKALDGIDECEILKLAFSLDQFSTHILAKALCKYANEKRIENIFPENFHEEFGNGVSGEINNQKYFFGKKKFLEEQGLFFSKEILEFYEDSKTKEQIIVFLGNSENVLGAVLFEDIIRPESKKIFQKFIKTLKVEVEILTGDSFAKARRIAEQLSVKSENVIAEVSPKQKLEFIKQLQKQNVVAMVGDGVNDAPALTAADVGIALSNNEKTISGEVSDIVILSGQLSSVLDAFVISKKTVGLAKQSIFFGMGASAVAMVLAGFGFIQPLNGAILQEVIDVVVILNALRLGQILKD